MQKVTSVLPSWEKTKTGSKAGFDKGWKLLDKLGAPVNKLSNKVGSEAFWPTTLDKECDKAARILQSFCKDGFYVEDDRPANDAVVLKGKQRVLKKIPAKVIQNAVGLAIFTTMRTGLWVSGAGGSGILIARKEDGTWSPPSGILLHTAGLGFLVGVDIYDCVVVINNRRALDSFTKIRATLGGEISAVAGPVGIGGVLENDGKWKQANRPVFTYLKSRGFYAGVQFDGTVIIERTDENERFYGQRIGVADILAGKARHPPYEIKMLMETVKAAEGRSDFDQGMMRDLETKLTPGDFELASPTTDGHVFGVPEPDDPDPFGFLALEKQGLEIREAGTKVRALSTQFEFNPSPTSPVYSTFHRKSMDTLATSRTNRDSYMSNRTARSVSSIDRATQTDMSTQTDERPSPATSPTHSSFDHPRIVEEDEKQLDIEAEDVDYTKIDLGSYKELMHGEDYDGTTAAGDSPPLRDFDSHPAVISTADISTADISNADISYATEDEEEEEEPVIFEAASTQATATSAVSVRGPSLVNIAKRPPPPPLPPRNSARSSRVMADQASGESPLKEGFEEVELHGVDHPEEHRKNKHGLEHLEKIESQVETPSRIEAPAQESPKIVVSEAPNFAVVGAFPDEETFHSLPATPMEVK